MNDALDADKLSKVTSTKKVGDKHVPRRRERARHSLARKTICSVLEFRNLNVLAKRNFRSIGCAPDRTSTFTLSYDYRNALWDASLPTNLTAEGHVRGLVRWWRSTGFPRRTLRNSDHESEKYLPMRESIYAAAHGTRIKQ